MERVIKNLIIGIVYLYKYAISPWTPRSCRYYPSCSTYFIEAVDKYGVIKGVGMGTKRILRCHPLAKGGYDPVK